MKIRGDLVVTRQIDSVRSNEALVAETLAADRAVDAYESAWMSLDPDGADREIELPDATTLPNGWKVVVQHSGAADNLNVRDYDGTFTGTLLKAILAPEGAFDTTAYQFVLIDNGTAAGTWYVVELGDSQNIAAVKYVTTFVIANWPAAVSGKRELTSTQVAGLGASTHGRGSNPVYIVQEDAGGGSWDHIWVDRERMNSSGDLALQVTANDSFDGRVIFV